MQSLSVDEAKHKNDNKQEMPHHQNYYVKSGDSATCFCKLWPKIFSIFGTFIKCYFHMDPSTKKIYMNSAHNLLHYWKTYKS